MYFPFIHILVGCRSISALDSAAVQRAKARQQYSTLARMKVTAGTASLRKSTYYLHFFFLHSHICVQIIDIMMVEIRYSLFICVKFVYTVSSHILQNTHFPKRMLIHHCHRVCRCIYLAHIDIIIIFISSLNILLMHTYIFEEGQVAQQGSLLFQLLSEF